MNLLEELKEIIIDPNVCVRWLKMPEDYQAFCECLKENNPKAVISLQDIREWKKEGIVYGNLFKEGKIVAKPPVKNTL
ncbi:MAG: hypothetical protein PHG08_03130 [Bacilli bacterium]|nr:hypothetical protein [Bacilli bacterium]